MTSPAGSRRPPTTSAFRLLTPRLPGRRGPRDREVIGDEDAPAAARWRVRRAPARRRSPRRSRPAPALAPDPAAVLRGHRRVAGPLRLGLPAADPAPARARGGRPSDAAADRGELLQRATSCSRRPLLRGHRASPPPFCSSTRSTGPTTSSRPSCSRSSPTTRSPSPRSAPSPRVAPPVVVLTSNRTREVHDALKRAASTTGSTTPGSSARWRSSAPGSRTSRRRSPARWRAAVHAARRIGLPQAARRGRDHRVCRALGAGPRPTSTPSRRTPRSAPW